MAKSPTIISASTVVKGRIHGDEDIDVQGRIEGQVEIGGQLTIEDEARVDAEVNAESVVVYGILVGNTSASQSIYLNSTARVVGDLTAPSIVIEDGAKIRGLVETGENVEGATKTKSRSTPSPVASKAVKTQSRAEPKEVESEPELDDDEPELPSGATKKKVVVKKRD